MSQDQKEFLYNFAKRYEFHIPEAKDRMRAETCKSLNMAYKQLKTIRDIPKFYRRLKAFLQKGFPIVTLKDTQFEHMECPELKMWLEKCVAVYQNQNITPHEQDKLITKMAAILTI